MRSILQKTLLPRYSEVRPACYLNSTVYLMFLSWLSLAQLVDFECWKTILARSEKNLRNINSEGAVCVLPNAMESRYLDVSGNIYAFGVLLLEIVSGRPPFCKDRGFLTEWVRRKLQTLLLATNQMGLTFFGGSGAETF